MWEKETYDASLQSASGAVVTAGVVAGCAGGFWARASVQSAMKRASEDAITARIDPFVSTARCYNNEYVSSDKSLCYNMRPDPCGCVVIFILGARGCGVGKVARLCWSAVRHLKHQHCAPQTKPQ